MLMTLPDGTLVSVDARGWRVTLCCPTNGLVVVDVLADSEADAKGVAHRLAEDQKLVDKVVASVALKHDKLSDAALKVNPPRYLQ
jgi:hypothetical protein